MALKAAKVLPPESVGRADWMRALILWGELPLAESKLSKLAISVGWLLADGNSGSSKAARFCAPTEPPAVCTEPSREMVGAGGGACTTVRSMPLDPSSTAKK